MVKMVQKVRGMKGSYAQVIGPLTQEVLRPYVKNWAYWGNVEATVKTDNDGREIKGFTITIKTKRGDHVYPYTRIEDEQGFFHWEEVNP